MVNVNWKYTYIYIVTEIILSSVKDENLSTHSYHVGLCNASILPTVSIMCPKFSQFTTQSCFARTKD